MREAVAFSPPFLQHNIANSSSSLPSLCHADEWCSNEAVPLSAYTAVIRQLYALTSGVCVSLCVSPFLMGMSDRYTRMPELWINSRGPSVFPLEYMGMMKQSLKEMWESKATRERRPAGVFIKSSFSPSHGHLCAPTHHKTAHINLQTVGIRLDQWAVAVYC